ncbi:hypothetical protein JW992_14980, partial [candidate division KSB1 bacterium]|nr:hypothetical protein [candidate division KSB1 bacterium]
MQAAVPKPRLISTISWILYDLANTAYSMNVVSLYFGTWVIIHLGQPDLVVSLANSISMALVALTLPVLGDWSDCKGKKLFSLFVFTAVCILGTAFLGGWDIILSKLAVSSTIGPDAVWSNAPLILGVLIVFTFILANYAYQGGLVFYNALLPAVSTPRTLGRVSGYGVALGYLGSIMGLLVAQVYVEGEILGFDLPGMVKQGPAAAFLPTALLFLVFAIPIFFFVPEPPLRPESRRSWNLKQSYRRV